MELVFTISIIVVILLFLFFGIPTIYDWMIFRGNHLSFIDPKRRTAAFGGGGRDLNPNSLTTIFGIFFIIFLVLGFIKILSINVF